LSVKLLANCAAKPPALALLTSVWLNSRRIVCVPPVRDDTLVVCAAKDGSMLPTAKPDTTEKLVVEPLVEAEELADIADKAACTTPSSKTRMEIGPAMAAPATTVSAVLAAHKYLIIGKNSVLGNMPT
jgi:hypothetical protein